MMYTVASVFLLLSVGYVKLGAFSRRYLIRASVFVICELCLSLSISHDYTVQQTIQLGMVNDLWSTLITVAALRAQPSEDQQLIVPGLMLSAIAMHCVPSPPSGAGWPRAPEFARNTCDSTVTSVTPIIDCGACFKFSNPDFGITPGKVFCYPLKRRRRASG